jgi:hypothetical protein
VVISNEEIKKELSTIRNVAEVLKNKVARLEERLAGGVSTSSQKSTLDRGHLKSITGRRKNKIKAA